MKISFRRRPVIILILVIVFQQCDFVFADSSSRGTKVVLIGIGGATWKVILPLMKQGRLPNLENMVNKGVWGELYVPDADMSSLTSIVTGTKGGKHGVMDYCEKLSGEYEAPFIPSYVRKNEALWNILTDNNKTSGVVNWWATCPAEQINGFIVSNAFFEYSNSPFVYAKYPKVYPAHFRNGLQRLSPSKLEVNQKLSGILGYNYENKKEKYENLLPERRFNLNLDKLSQQFKEIGIVVALRGFLRRDLYVFNVGRDMLRKNIPDAFLIFFWGPDIVQHSFWEFYEPNAQGCHFATTEAEINKFGKVIPRYYELIDAMIGEIISQYKNEQDVIVTIVSDHGFQGQPIWKFRKLFKINFIFEKLGWLKYEASDRIDWKKTLIYDFPHFQPSLPGRKVYLNLKGRDPQGIIESGAEYEQFLKKIKETLGSLKTTSGQNIFRKIELVKTLDESSRIQSPDLLIEFNQSIILSPDIKCEINKNFYPITEFMIPWPRSGTHDNSGVVIFYNPAIKNGERIQDATVYDIMPTILDLMHVPGRQNISGKVLKEVEKVKKR